MEGQEGVKEEEEEEEECWDLRKLDNIFSIIYKIW